MALCPSGPGQPGRCLLEVSVQAAVLGLAFLGVLAGCLTTRSVPRCSRTSATDQARSALLALLFLAGAATLALGVFGLAGVVKHEILGAALWLAALVLLCGWHRREVMHSLRESPFIKLWWLVALADRALVLYFRTWNAEGAVHIETAPFAISCAEAVLCLALLAAYFTHAASAREPLLDGEDPESTFERTVSTRDPSPETQINLLGFLAFSWFTPIVDLAARRDAQQGKLELTDVYPLVEKDCPRGQLEKLDAEWRAELCKPTPSLGAALKRAYKWEVVGTAWIKFLNDALHFVGPFLLNRVINFVQKREEDEHIGYFYAVAMVLSSASQAFLMAHYFQQGYRTGMRMRAALILMSYQKALRVLPWPTPEPPQEAAPQPEQGRRRCFRQRAPRQKPRPGVGGMGQMTNLISADTDKFTFLMPYFNLIWSAPLQVVICFTMLFSYVQWALLAGVVVMVAFTFLSGWVQGKARKVQALAMKAKDERLKVEVELLKIVKVIKQYAWENTIEDKVRELRNKELALQLRYKLWAVGMFLSFSLSPTLVALGTFSCYTVVMGNQLDAPTAFTALSLFNILTFPLGAMPMMARFFAEARVAKDRLEAFFLAPEVAPRPGPSPDAGVVVSLKAKQLRWPGGVELLRDIEFTAKRGDLVTVVGKTGVGKSGLLFALLGELPIDPADGRVCLTGSVGYCAQTAWVRNASLRDNIIGSQRQSEADMERYEAVLDACALRQDLEVLPQGDETMIGDRGINLSGGQKQRVALARAVYSDPDIYILDDVLSALDAHVASHICTNLLRGPLLKGKTTILVTHSRRALPLASQVVVLDDKEISYSGSYEGFRASGKVEQLEEPSSKDAEDGAAADAKNEKPQGSPKDGGGNKSTPQRSKPAAPPQEERRSGAVSWAVYRAYAAACGGVLPVGFFLLTVTVSEGSKNLSDAWLAKWSNSGGAATGATVYALTALLSMVGGLAYVVTRVFVGQAGSRRLHESCVNALLRAQMTFFDLTPTGQILNRLAEDTNILDYNLPQTMAANLVWFWRSTAIVVVCMLVSWYLFFLIVPMFLLYARLAKRYLPATRDLRRLDAAARSPIFSHFSETMAGVSTIRAMQQQDLALRTNVHKMESQMEAYYLSNTAARWLSLRLQFNGTILVGAVCILGIALSADGALSAGLVGLAITYAMKLTDTLNQVNRESADRETQMVSVERVHHYCTSVPSEAPLLVPGQPASQSWPERGEVNVENVTMRYREGLPTVLNGISLSVKPGERVGIVGRTGCGKSSFLAALLRLVEAEAGHVLIDGVNARGVGLHSLREKAAIIPQDPAILTGTVRFNLDPFGAKQDEEIWDALEKSQLRKRVEEAGGLDSKVEEGGGNYSVGELQLLCLARALLRRQERGGLLLLDEATSALDAETDATIQHVIRSDFKCTTITIAHRIQTLLDYDRVVVLDAGRVVEFDSPQELLKRASQFQALAREAGLGS